MYNNAVQLDHSGLVV